MSAHKHLGILLSMTLLLVVVIAGCGGSDRKGPDKNPPADLPAMDYATFKAKVLSHQVQAVVVYPDDQVMTVVTTESGQIFRVSYNDMVISAGGTSLTDFLLNNDVPFTFESPE